MIDLILFFLSIGIKITVIALVIWFIFYKFGTLKGSLITTGEIVKAETELLSSKNYMDKDRRNYRYYVKYLYDNQEFIAKSFRTYGRAIYFPGDLVQIKVSDKDKTIVDLIKIVGRKGT